MKTFKKVLSILLFLLGSTSIYAQNLPHDEIRNMNTAQAGPNGTSITPQQPMQVDLYTGKASAGFQLFNYSNPGNGLNHSISLNYSGGGIKVDDIASNVGLGWNLNTGGIVIRQMVGLADEEPDFGFSTVTDTTYSELYAGVIDGEIDHYMYVAGNASGQFVIGKNNQIVSSVKSNVKVERNVVSLGSMTTTCPNINFKVTLENGVQYLYQNYDCSVIGISTIHASSTWYLTQIISPFNTDTIFFNYTSRNLTYYTGKSTVKYTSGAASQTFNTDLTATVSNDRQLSSVTYPDNTVVTFNYDTFKRLDLQGDYALSNIVISNGTSSYGYVFNYSYFGPVVSGLSGTTNNITYQNYDAALTGKPEQNYRLKLNGFQKFSGVLTNRLKGHVFSYDNTLLIARGAASQVDDWGYQSSNSGLRVSTSRPPGLAGSKASSLTSIALPTGGSISWEYELHSTNSTVHPSRIDFEPTALYSSQAIGNFSTIDTWSDQSASFSPTLGAGINTIYNRLEIAPSTGFPTCWDMNSSTGVRIYVIISKLVSGSYSAIYTTSFLRNSTSTAFYDFTSAPGDQFKINYNIVDDFGTTSANCAHLQPNNYITSTLKTYRYSTKVGLVGGLRVKKIIQSDGVDASKDIVKEYRYETLNNTPSGIMINYPVRTFSYSECYKNDGVYVHGHPVYYASDQVITSPVNYTNYSFTVLTDNSLSPVHSLGGGIIGYGCVQEFTGTAASNNGKVVSEFSTFNDYTYLSTYKTNVIPFSPQELEAVKYGLPLRTTVYDTQGIKVKKSENTFSTESTILNQPEFTSRKVLLTKTGCGLQNDEGAHPDDIYVAVKYYPVTGITSLTDQKETEYFSNGDSLISTTTTDYDAAYHVPLNVKITNSKGELITQKNYYPFQYNIANEITSLKNANIQYSPIVSEVWKGISSPILLNANATTFQTFTNGIIKPLNSYSLIASNPISQSAWGSFINTQILQQSSLYKLNGTVKNIDTKANITETISNGLTSSSIWGYKKSRIIADAVNASSSEIGFTSFESDDKNSWTIYSTSTIATDAYNGSSSLKIAPNTDGVCGTFAPNVTSGSQNKKYLFSCWVKTETGIGANKGVLNIYTTYNLPNSTVIYPVVSGSFKSISFGDTFGAWKYFEVVIDLDQVHTTSGDGSPFKVRAYVQDLDTGKYILIDDIRFQPLDAQMNTYTHNPLFGITSEMNANNSSTRYTYDEFGRLKLVRDLNGYILKKLEYNYKP